jgi:hypothetical protein
MDAGRKRQSSRLRGVPTLWRKEENMITVRHKFPAEAKVFGIVYPPSELYRDRLNTVIKVVDTKNPDIFCTAKVIEVLDFDIIGKLNYFPDWLSMLLFGQIADPILGHILNKYPEAKEQNHFEIWILKKM